MLRIGERAPLFSAESQIGPVELGEHIGNRPIVLIFYPKNETPICTKQLCTVRDAKQQYIKFHALVLGINPAGVEDHRKFAERHKLDFPLVSDPDGTINAMYKVGNMLFGLIGQKRIVYVIDFLGNIVYAKKGNRPTHEILEALKTVQAAPVV